LPTDNKLAASPRNKFCNLGSLSPAVEIGR
jgi:hypothetical protein